MPSVVVRTIAAVLAGGLLCGAAMAQEQPPEPPKPYKKVSVSLPAPIADPSLDAFRKQFADIAQRKDRAALGALVVPQGFFWERESGNGADEKKSAFDNFAAATGLDAPDGSGWDFLADYAAEPTASAVVNQKDTVCAPANPIFNEEEFVEIVKATESNPFEWGYTVRDGVEARETAEPDSGVVEKLGLHFIRVMFDGPLPDAADTTLRIATPSGKIAFVPADVVSPLGIDQLCYIKLDGGWKIVGYIGEGAPP